MIAMTLRRRLLAARIAWRAFLMPGPGTDCVFSVCDGTGILSIVDMGGAYEQDCLCAPLAPRMPKRVERRMRDVVLAEVQRRRQQEGPT